VIEITRSLARKLVIVLRKSVWAASGPGRAPAVVVRGGPDGLTLSCQWHGGPAVQYGQRGQSARATVVLPAHVLRSCAGPFKTPVRLERLSPDRCAARWQESGRPCEQEFPAEDPEKLLPFPEPPASFEPAGPGLLAALDDAAGSADALQRSPRFALQSLQLRGAGVIVGTDGMQLLWQEGFRFPWQGEVFVPATGVFGSKPLRGKPASVGRTDRHVVVRAGHWTVALPVDREGKFPRVEAVLEALPSDGTHWQVPDEEAAFLLRFLPRLPGARDTRAVTIELGGGACVRAKDESGEPGTELVLTRSRVTGPALRVVTDPRFFARALKLGFRSFDLAPGKPVSSREGQRRFVWMPLDRSPLDPQAGARRIFASGRPGREH
jgi:hypothetical protein